MMKRITLPEPVKMYGVAPDGKSAMVEVDLPGLLNEQCWNLKYWRNGSSDRLHQVLLLSQLLAVGTKPGTKVDLQSRDHEALVEATMSIDLKGPNTLPVITLLCSLTDAKDVIEEKKA
jgi:hypothetical protein